MNAHARFKRPILPPEQRLTVAEFLAFYDSRPDGEKWELIDGVAVMSPTPVDYHQVVATNILTFLMNHKRRTGATWTPFIGTSTRVPMEHQLPEPDALVREAPLTGLHVTDDAIVLFEVLSRSNTRADQDWRKRMYASVPNCQHYVTVSLKKVEVVVMSRESVWRPVKATDIAMSAELPAIGVSLPLAEVYLWTPLGPSTPP
jgi:Uma2 family endonuclease